MRSAARTVIAGPSISASDRPGGDERPVLDEDGHARRRREKGEEAGEERGSGDDGALAADDPGREPGGRPEDGQRGHVLAVLGKCAGEEVVEVVREVPGELRHARTEYLRRARRRADPMQMTGMSGPFLRGIIEPFARPPGRATSIPKEKLVNVRSGRLVFASVLVLLAAGALADEGMWMPQQIPQLAPRLKEMGFQGDPQAFADLTGQPMGAIVSLGGCSASFVSPDGLIVTNNHCVQGALQYNSKPDRNLMVDGYLAKTRSDELWNGPGSRVYVTVSVKDVTDEIAGKLDPKLTDRKRFDAIEQRVKAKTAECEKGGLRCSVSPFFEGLKWFELGQMEIQDVRLVYAPPAGIGNFGGETDNWQWPRHTGDWSFYRAYVSKDGKAVPSRRTTSPTSRSTGSRSRPRARTRATSSSSPATRGVRRV